MKKLGNEWKKGVSVVMAALLVCGSVQIPAQAKEAESRIRKNALTAVQKLNPEVKTAEAELSDQDKKQLAKEETVYVIANADGSPEKLIVSDWLKNAMGSETLEDATELTDIVNVKGTEGFEKKQGALGVWDAAGNDIYYQGSIQKELPVDLKVTYQLNGRTVSPEELAGKSGKVNIRFDYTNRQKEAVMVGEKEEDLYVPFVVMTGLVLDNENFRNIEVSNGKVINDGERTIVMGYAMPGLKDNLDIGSEDFDVEELDIPEYVELTADVTDFELATTMTVATNEIFGDMDISVQDKMDDLSADMDELQDAMNELMDGTAELYDGVLELYDGTEELTDGIDELDDGAGKLNDGARDLRDGAKELYNGVGTLKTGAGALFAGVKQLADGLKQITQNDKALNDGAAGIYAGLLEMANGQISALNEALKGTGMQLAVLSQPKTPQEINKFMNDITNNQKTIQGLLANPDMVKGMIEQMVGAQFNGISIQSLENEVLPVMLEEDAEQEAQQEPDSDKPAEASEPANTESTTEQKTTQAATETTTATEGEEKKNEASQEPEEAPAEELDSKEEGQEEADESMDSQESEEEPLQDSKAQEEQQGEAQDPAPQEVSQKSRLQGNNVVMVGTSQQPTPDQIIAGIKAQIVAQTYTQLMQTLTMANGTLELLKGAYQMNLGVGSYTQGVDQVYAGVQELMKNAPALNSGIDALNDGAGKLASGASELKSGTRELKDGTEELKDGGQELRDGVEELRDGSKELKDGTIEFNDEGIQKLVDTFDGDLTELSNRFEGVKSAAKAYQSFAGISEGAEGNVRFIYKTSGIEK